MVAAMEEKYLPKAPQIVAKEVQKAPQKTNVQQQTSAHADPQRVTIQQKPYYSANDIVRALSAIRGEKVAPKQLREAYGWATLADLLGFADKLNE
ncbi:hypothetical protein ES707_16906 [subsurface metagenome]